MTDQELQQLAREYAEQYLPFSNPDLTKADRNDMVETMTDYAVEILRWLTKTHCIVSRELILSQHAWYMQRMKEVSSARQTNGAKAIALEAAFGIDMFETLKPTEQ